MPFLEATVYSLKAPYGTETSEKGKQTVLFHATPIINIPVLAKHLWSCNENILLCAVSRIYAQQAIHKYQLMKQL